jgi:hypothetical protein
LNHHRRPAKHNTPGPAPVAFGAKQTLNGRRSPQRRSKITQSGRHAIKSLSMFAGLAVVEQSMYRVTADTLGAYLNFDPSRRADLLKLHELTRKAAPGLARYFHKGTPAGEAGMRMKMIGYGKFRYAVKSGQTVEWPVIGVALQKNYISVYVAIRKNGRPIVETYAGGLGELRSGHNNFSFERYDDLKAKRVSALFGEIDHIFENDPQNPVRYMEGA